MSRFNFARKFVTQVDSQAANSQHRGDLRIGGPLFSDVRSTV
jgi:hypothetical protein